MCEFCSKTGGGGGTGDARDELKRTVWRVLKHLKYWVSEDDYDDLHGDRERGNVYNRALMRFVPISDIQTAYSDAQRAGHAGDTITNSSLPAAARPGG